MIRMRLASRLSVTTILLLSFLSIPNMLIHPVRASPDVVNVSISGFAFNPQNLTILRGDTVVWNNTDQVIYTLWFVYLANESTFLLSEPISPGTTFAQTFNDEVNLQYFSFERLWIIGFVTVIEDFTPPTIEDPVRHPEGDITPDQSVRVSVNVTDATSGVKNTTLSYTTDNGTSWIDLPMTYNSTSGLYQTLIPGHPYCTWVRHKIIAYDNAENPTVKDNAGEYYVYHVVPEFPAVMILPLFMFFTLIAIALAKKNRYEVTSRTT